VSIIDLLSRLLFVALVINELIAVRSTPKEQHDNIIMPKPIWLTAITLLLPFVFRLELPTWLGLTALGIQAFAFAIHLLSQAQLIRAKSFAVVTDAGTNVQTRRRNECPDHRDVPLSGKPDLCGYHAQYVWLVDFHADCLHRLGLVRDRLPQGRISGASAPDQERQHLMKLGAVHSGLDSPFWGERPAIPAPTAPAVQGEWLMEAEEREKVK